MGSWLCGPPVGAEGFFECFRCCFFKTRLDLRSDAGSALAPRLAKSAEVALAQIVPSLSKRLKQRALNNSRHFINGLNNLSNFILSNGRNDDRGNAGVLFFEFLHRICAAALNQRSDSFGSGVPGDQIRRF